MMIQSTTIRVSIVDDVAIVRQGLATIVDRDPEMTAIAQAEDGQQAIALFREYQPDVTLMDLRMSQMSGVEEIVAILNIGESTVKSHVNRILSKLGVNDRTQAAIVAIKRGIVYL